MRISLRYTQNRLFRMVKSQQFLAFLIFTTATVALAMLPLRAMCKDLAYRVNWAYFPIFISSRFSMQLLMGAILLFANAPFITPLDPYELIRGSRRCLFWGNVLYILMLVIFYILFLFVVSMLFLFPYVTFTAGWGKVLDSYYFSDLQYKYFGITAIADGRILVKNFQPLALLWRAVGMNVIQYSFLGCAMQMLALRFPKKKYVHGVFALAHVFSPRIALAFGSKSWFRFLPASWMELYILNLRGSASGATPTVFEALGIVFVCILLSTFMSACLFQHEEIYSYLGENK